MSILYFSDVLRKVGLDPAKVKLIRHSLRDKGFKECYEKNMVFEYTCHQKANFSKSYEYWVIFISDSSTLAKLHSIYRVCGSVPDTKDRIPQGLPSSEAEGYNGQNAFFFLEIVDLLREYEGKLIIDWGSSALMWHQKAQRKSPLCPCSRMKRRCFLATRI